MKSFYNYEGGSRNVSNIVMKAIRYGSFLLVMGSIVGLALIGTACEIEALEEISVTPESIQLEEVGQTMQYEARGTYADGSHEGLTAEVVWSSSDMSVVTISEGGLAISVGMGQAEITATMQSVISNVAYIEVLGEGDSQAADSGTIPDIPAQHPESNCGSCHSSGIGNTPIWPAGHSSYTESTCNSCHATSTASPEGNGGTTTSPDITPIPAGHPTSSCGYCHSSPTSEDTPPWPSGHEGYSENLCTSCHKVSTEDQPSNGGSSDSISVIPAGHPTMGCVPCHSVDNHPSDAPQWPDGHEDLSESCDCHPKGGV
ncbi:MAG: Ig-like domain-containing protein [Chloroflexota bacterium]|nr:Ig-like domain-containing protein [Chloroflexota bacterium]